MLQVTFNEADRILLDMADDAEATLHYDQRVFGNGCGSPACMLGTYGWKHPGSVVHDYLKAQTKYLKEMPEYPPEHLEEIYPRGLFNKLLDVLEISEDEWDDLFEENGCDAAYFDGKRAAAFVREFVRQRALARIKQ